MKNFFTRYSYTAVRLFLNQFAIALFGMSLALACGRAGNRSLQIATSILSVVFYLFLNYATMWEVGAKDGISADARKEPRRLFYGFWVGVLANAINILLALMILPGAFVPIGHPVNGISAVASVIALMIQGMYQGILAVPFRGLALHDFAWVYFAIVLPAILVSGIAYILGSYNLHATNILIQKNKDVKNNGRPDRKK